MDRHDRPSRVSLRCAQFGLLGGLVLLLSAFGCGAGGSSNTGTNGGSTQTAVPTFDSTRAFADLQSQCSFGPRNPGSSGHEACRQWILAQFQAATSDVTEQTFDWTTPDSTKYSFDNLIAVFGATPTRPLASALMITAHWDTRPVADQDPDPAKRGQPILGANDGASGVAVLTELARAFKAQAPPQPVILVALDFEDGGQTTLTTGEPYSGFSIGARHLAANLGRFRPAQSICVDMVGDTHPEYPQEANSQASAPNLVNLLWNAGQALGFAQFESRSGLSITDDHLPLIAAGVPSVDIIDFDYPGPSSNKFWHTTSDIPANCDPAGLKAVGQTLLQVIYRGG